MPGHIEKGWKSGYSTTDNWFKAFRTFESPWHLSKPLASDHDTERGNTHLLMAPFTLPDQPYV
jgi:hypothetical protein